jgi:hypothetical protein
MVPNHITPGFSNGQGSAGQFRLRISTGWVSEGRPPSSEEIGEFSNAIPEEFQLAPASDQFAPSLNKLLHKRCAGRPFSWIELAHLQSRLVVSNQLGIAHLA